MANPFRLAELVWDDDVNLDGVALSYASPPILGGFSGHIVGGAFPLSYAPDDDPTTRLVKTPDAKGSKWLYAVQGGVNWRSADKFSAELDVAFYDYQNVAGQL